MILILNLNFILIYNDFDFDLTRYLIFEYNFTHAKLIDILYNNDFKMTSKKMKLRSNRSDEITK